MVSLGCATGPHVRSQLETLTEDALASGRPGAAVLVAKGDTVLLKMAKGLANVELDVQLAPGHVFRIGSVTKPLVATAVLTLVEEGQLALSDPLSKFVPGIPNGERITLAELLSHTAGVSDAWELDPAKHVTTEDLVAAIRKAPADFPPGEGWSYSNSGYMLLGAVLEQVTGQPWHEVVRQRVAERAGMSRTRYHEDSEIIVGRAEGYTLDESGAVARAPSISMSGPAAAGALYSTTEDLFRFVRALRSGKLVNEAVYAEMASARQTRDGSAVRYGYGVSLGTVHGLPVWEHPGGIDGFASQLIYFPKEDVTVVLLANSDAGDSSPRSLARRLGAMAADKPYPSMAVVKLTSGVLKALVGTYRTSGSEVRSLSMRNGRLFSRRGQGPERELQAAADDRLIFAGDGTDYFRIVWDKPGEVAGLDFHPDAAPQPQREARER